MQESCFYYFVSKCTIACSSLDIEIIYVVYLEQDVKVYKWIEANLSRENMIIMSELESKDLSLKCNR